MKRHRIFVAIELSDQVKELIASICQGIHRARWVKKDGLHLTLKFIGEVDDTDLEAAKKVLERVRSATFKLTLSQTGFFGKKNQAHVLWLGVEKNESLIGLYQQIEGTLAEHGIAPKENRLFAPHITLARFRDLPLRLIKPWLDTHRNFETEPFAINHFHLFSSRLTPEGAVYTKEQTYLLADF